MLLRIKAFAVHLCISLVILGGGVLLMLSLWYPDGLVAPSGAFSVVVTVLAVDLCLGPLITLIVYNPAKAELKRDLITVVLIQLVAFSYGAWTLADGRPVWIVFHDGYFQLVRQPDLDLRNINAAKAEYRQLGWTGPRWVASVVPADEKRDEQEQRILESILGGVTPAQKPEYYLPLDAVQEKIIQAARPLKELEKTNPVADVERYRHRYPDTDAFLPLRTASKPLVVLIQRSTGEIGGVADLVPF